MPRLVGVKSVVRFTYSFLASMVIAVVAPMVADKLINLGSPFARTLGAVVGIVSWLPWMALVAWAVYRSDEFERRVHLVALAVAFGGAILALLVSSWLVRAGFIGYPDLSLLTIACFAIWFVAMFASSRYHRGRE